MYDKQILNLHFSQLLKAWEKSKHNNYSDRRKKSYQDSLNELFACLKNDDFENLNPNQVQERSIIINFFFQSLGILDYSTLNQFPFEIIYCLDYALDDWTSDNDKYLIVTSFVNDYAGYSFDGRLALVDDYYEIIKQVYNIVFEYRLIQINLPKFLARDYFSNTVLYHELGHFIDHKYKISESLLYQLANNLNNGTYAGDSFKCIQKLFPFNVLDPNNSLFFLSHLKEYVSDIFASQYIGKSSNYFLNYITGYSNLNNTSTSHPSTANRNDLVNDFLSNVDNILVTEIKAAFASITTVNQISIKYKELKYDEILNLIPPAINFRQELSSLFLLIWEIFNTYDHQIEKNNNFGFQLKPSKTYEILNNLIEKSIANFIICDNWEKAKDVLNKK